MSQEQSGNTGNKISGVPSPKSITPGGNVDGSVDGRKIEPPAPPKR